MEQEEDEGIEVHVYTSTSFSSFPPSIIICNYILQKGLPQISLQDFPEPYHTVPAAFPCISVLLRADPDPIGHRVLQRLQPGIGFSFQEELGTTGVVHSHHAGTAD